MHARTLLPLLRTGYDFVYFDAVNRFYVAQEHAELKQYFQHPPCVWDNFVDYRLVQAQQDCHAGRKAA